MAPHTGAATGGMQCSHKQQRRSVSASSAPPSSSDSVTASTGDHRRAQRSSIPPTPPSIRRTPMRSLPRCTSSMVRSSRRSTRSRRPNRLLLTYHDSFAYFADALRHDRDRGDPTSGLRRAVGQEVVELIDQIRAEHVPAIFGSEVFPSPVLAQIAQETGAHLRGLAARRRPAWGPRAARAFLRRPDALRRAHDRVRVWAATRRRSTPSRSRTPTIEVPCIIRSLELARRRRSPTVMARCSAASTSTIREGAFCRHRRPVGSREDARSFASWRARCGPAPARSMRRPDGRRAPRLGVVPQIEHRLGLPHHRRGGRDAPARPAAGRLPWATRAMRDAVDAVLEQLGIARPRGADTSGTCRAASSSARSSPARWSRKPDLLLLDEPTSGVDVATRHDILHLLHELNHEGIAIVITTHDSMRSRPISRASSA